MAASSAYASATSPRSTTRRAVRCSSAPTPSWSACLDELSETDMAQAPELMLDTNTEPTPLTPAPAPIQRAAGQPLVADVAVTSTRQPADAVLPTYKRPPGEIVRGEGVYLVDSDGKRYLDFVSGIAVNALGYGDPGLVATLHAAAEGLVHVSICTRRAQPRSLPPRSSSAPSRTRCSSATPEQRRTKARSSSRDGGRAPSAK